MGNEQKDYETDNEHTTHVGFVSNRWEKQVTQFMER